MPPPNWLRRLLRTPLRTRRLEIRTVRRGDERLIYPAVRESLNELAPWLIWARADYDAAMSREFVRAAMDNFKAGRDYALLMTTRGGELVGGTGFHVRGASNARYYEIGYWCRSSFAGQGYTTEAVRGLLRYAFRSPSVRRIEIRCDPRNRASERVIEKAGLQKEGRLRKVARDQAGRLHDQIVFAKVR